jgi:hypothetical protein
MKDEVGGCWLQAKTEFTRNPQPPTTDLLQFFVVIASPRGNN